MKRIAIIICTVFAVMGLKAQALSQKYDKDHPLVIVGDWDRAPYEFLNDQGKPAGINIDIMRAICEELDISYKFVLKEWSSALKTFERGDADIILANGKRYQEPPYVISKNIINFDRICVATLGDTTINVTLDMLADEGVVLKPADFNVYFFKELDSLRSVNLEFLSPKVAMQQLVEGDIKYFVWDEEPLKWKIKELNLEGITLCDVSIPVNEIRIIGHNQELIYELDDTYSRLKQRGEVQSIDDRWLHPERQQGRSWFWFIYAALGALVIGALLYASNRMAKAHVHKTTRHSIDLNKMMSTALHMGNFHVMLYDMRRDLMTNLYGAPLLPAEGITLKEFTERIHADEMDEFTRKMNKLLNGQERKFELKKRWRAFTDTVQWLNLEGQAMVELDDDGRPAYIINIVNNITQNIEETYAIRDLERKYAGLSSTPVIAVSSYDKDGWLIDINNAMKQICGIHPQNAESERFWLTVCMFDIPLFRNAYSPKDKNKLLACVHMEYPEIGLDDYIEYHVHPLLDEQGEVVNYFITSIDITDYRNNDHELHQCKREIRNTIQRIEQSDQWLRFITKQANAYLWYSDSEKQTAYVHRSLHTNPKDLITLPFATICEHLQAEERQTVLDNLNSREHFNVTQHFVTPIPDLGGLWYHVFGTPIFNADGRMTGHQGLAIDITEEMAIRKRLEKETLIANDIMRLKSGFMASMTHELRTPLNAIIGFTEVLAMTEEKEERKEFIRIVRNNCDMLQRLIDDILSASSLSDSHTSIQAKEIDFSKAFDDICLTLQQRVQDEVEFIKDNPYETFYTIVDTARINQVITNFVTNAVKFTKQGYIKVGYHYERHGLHIFCEDTGGGIPQDKQDIIFERFVKLDDFVQGTGMGLNICRTIVKSMGGEIGVTSEGEGKGSTFWCWIPCERKLTTTNHANL